MCEGLEGVLGPIWERMSRGWWFRFNVLLAEAIGFIDPLNQLPQSQMNESSFMFVEVMTAIKI